MVKVKMLKSHYIGLYDTNLLIYQFTNSLIHQYTKL